MFLLILTYKKPLAIVDQYLVAHREFLSEAYLQNNLIVSGPLNPRAGGIIFTRFVTREAVENFICQDPFYQHEIADYQIIEFDPVKYHPNFQPCLV